MDNRETSSAVTRIKSLLAKFRFVEIVRPVIAISTYSIPADLNSPSDAVVPGYCTID